MVQACDEEKLLGHLGVVLYEYLGEEYPEVLGSILGALKSIVNVIGMQKMTPPIKDLLPRLTPILKNRHEKVRKLPPPKTRFSADPGCPRVRCR
jgi:splicing factor 3B subunit 1